MIEQEELPYTSSSGWESWPSDFSSGMDDTFGGRDMQIGGLEPLHSTYRNHEIIIDRQLGTLHGHAAEDDAVYRRNLRSIRRLRTQMRGLNVNSRNFPEQQRAFVEQSRLQSRIDALNERVNDYEIFIENGGSYSDDDIIN